MRNKSMEQRTIQLHLVEQIDDTLLLFGVVHHLHLPHGTRHHFVFGQKL